jgi:hypothetical protein
LGADFGDRQCRIPLQQIQNLAVDQVHRPPLRCQKKNFLLLRWYSSF